MFSIGRLFCKRRAFFLGFHYFEKNAVMADQSLLLQQQQQQQLHYSLPVRFLSTSHNRNRCEEQDQDQSLKVEVSYLVNSCGLSPEIAASACKRVRLVNLEKSGAVIHLLKTHGFCQNQISGMIRRSPQLLLSKQEETLVPKLNYLYSIGASGADVVRIFSKCPWIFGRSLEKHIVPAFDVVRDLVGTNKKAIATINRYPSLLYVGLVKNFIPNIKKLRDERVHESGVSYLLNFWPSALLISSCRFVKTVEKVKALGFNPSTVSFAVAVLVMNSMSKSKLEKKLGVLQRWGWSEDITYKAFRRYPFCLALSEDKINAVMHFFVNKAGVEASYIARYPGLLGYSLEKRVIPRYTINQILMSRGFKKITDISCNSLLKFSNQCFKDKFVTPYLEEAPELLDLFMAKTN